MEGRFSINMRSRKTKQRMRVVSHLAKLTPSQVRRIRERISRGESLSPIARDNGVSQPTISNIKNGKTYLKVA